MKNQRLPEKKKRNERMVERTIEELVEEREISWFYKTQKNSFERVVLKIVFFIRFDGKDVPLRVRSLFYKKRKNKFKLLNNLENKKSILAGTKKPLYKKKESGYKLPNIPLVIIENNKIDGLKNKILEIIKKYKPYQIKLFSN